MALALIEWTGAVRALAKSGAPDQRPPGAVQRVGGEIEAISEEVKAVLRNPNLLRELLTRYQAQIAVAYGTGLFARADASIFEGMPVDGETRQVIGDALVSSVDSSTITFLRALEEDSGDQNVRLAIGELELELIGVEVIRNLVLHFEPDAPALMRTFEALAGVGADSFASTVLARLRADEDWLWAIVEGGSVVDQSWTSAVALAKIETESEKERLRRWAARLSEPELRAIVATPSPFREEIVVMALELLGGAEQGEKVLVSGVAPDSVRSLYVSFLQEEAETPADVGIVEFIRRCALSEAVGGEPIDLAEAVAAYLENDDALLRSVLMAEPERIHPRPWVISLIEDLEADQEFFGELLGRLNVQEQVRIATSVVERVTSEDLIDTWLKGLNQEDLAFVATHPTGFRGSIRKRASAMLDDRTAKTWRTELN